MKSVSELLAAALLGACVIFFAVFVASVLGTLAGAVTGWFVGLLFAGTIADVLQAFHITNLSTWELGAFLGFVAGFFRTTATVKAS